MIGMGWLGKSVECGVVNGGLFSIPGAPQSEAGIFNQGLNEKWPE